MKRFLRNIFFSFFNGMKSAETDMFSQKTTVNDAPKLIQHQQAINLGDALLKGEITEEVEKLRDRTYWVADESKNYEVVVDNVNTTKAFKKIISKNEPKVFKNNSDVLIVMDNDPIPSTVLKTFESVGGYGIPDEYPLKFTYEYNPPKFILENYVNKLVVRKDLTDNKLLLDLYVPQFTDSFERMKRIFNAFINKVKEGINSPNNLMFNEIDFETLNTYGVADGHVVNIKFVKFIEINEFDGKYLLTYEIEYNISNEKITDKYKNDKLRESYNNKEQRTTTAKLQPTDVEIKSHCDSCNVEMNEYDYNITKATYGKGLCKKCLNDKLI